MAGKTFLALLLVCCSMLVNAQEQPVSTLLGSWSGKLDVGLMKLTLVLNIEQKDGQLMVTLDSPDQGARGIAATKEYLSDDSVAVKVVMINANYRAKLNDGKLEGTFTQNGFSLPLVLTRGVPAVTRPQNPLPPYPYETREFFFVNEADGAMLAGTLTYPVGYDVNAMNTTANCVGEADGMIKRPIAVLLVSGSGQQNRDEELMDHKPFLVIADYLARHGIATLRYDDRATGASVGGEVTNGTTFDFARDAAAGLAFLRSQNTFGKIGVLGHSEGGSIAFLLGAEQKTDFIVSLAGPGVKGDTLLAAQSNRIMELSGMSGAMTAEEYRQQPTVQQNTWLKWFVDYDPTDDIRHTQCPVFVLNGDRDCQVLSSLNLDAFRRLLPPSEKNCIKEYPQLNHLFQHCSTGLPTEYGEIDETISPAVLEDIAEWINGL